MSTQWDDFSALKWSPQQQQQQQLSVSRLFSTHISALNAAE